MRGHKKILHKGICLKDTKKYSFPQSIDAWNGLKEEVIMAKNVHQLKDKLDKYRYGDRTTRVQLRPCILQLGKYTHTHTHTMLDGLDRRKATGPDNISNWMLRECSSQLAEKICDMINT